MCGAKPFAPESMFLSQPSKKRKLLQSWDLKPVSTTENIQQLSTDDKVIQPKLSNDDTKNYANNNHTKRDLSKSVSDGYATYKRLVEKESKLKEITLKPQKMNFYRSKALGSPYVVINGLKLTSWEDENIILKGNIEIHTIYPLILALAGDADVKVKIGEEIPLQPYEINANAKAYKLISVNNEF